MAAGILPRPGSEYGPCEGSCPHRDCAASHEMAARICPLCTHPIGYGVRFFQDSDEPSVFHHAECVEIAAEIDSGLGDCEAG